MPDGLTVHSSDIAYATPQEMLIRYDKRLIGRLISDVGVPVTDDFDLTTNNVLRVLLKEASAIVESYAYKGKRYTREDLQNLYNNTGRVGRELLVGLVCAITLYLLWRRRGDPSIEIPKDYQIAVDMLRRLERGENIFAFDETMASGIKVSQFSRADTMNSNVKLIAMRRFIGNAGYL